MSLEGVTFVLVHSPFTGAGTWRQVAGHLAELGHRSVTPSLEGVEHSPQPHWRWCAERVTEAASAAREPVAIVGHSGAGLLLPLVGRNATPNVVAYVFVDAAIPAPAGSTPVVPAEFVADLEARAEGGRLPKWSRWWPEDVVRGLLPDDDARRRFEAELPALPLSIVYESVPVPLGWPDAPCAYLQFSSIYEPVAREAAARGWRTKRVAGEHLHMLVDPGAVAEALVELVAQMAIQGRP